MGTPIRLIAGLGNPGSQYDKTRHNAGFWFVDELARRYSGQFAAEKRFSGDVCKLQVGSNVVWLIKPMTFMNRSGLAVRQLADFYRIPVEQVLVAHDELDIPAGDVRLKQAGGHGGHNGLRDLHAHLGADYWRLRLGVGHPGDRNKVVDYVLSRPSQDDEIVILRAIDTAADQIGLILQGEMQKAMQALHTR
ncbi:MAG TPA: aminoacyl-tRNA hydrolase [Candidatus Thiothrix moscowensis]|uniref:aminoacyl-tRNA hydrolase n=1 Tax=unclassified Thiothrix TaxID=2636184 RepID=UPI0025E9DD3B|nr:MULTISPECIES: aminoacyl-tRNA hydrolase [unclassified Thiothrix]HRJ53313.1 aminoacyl-tRNA hydrolase [Candidatus Thiothrix moscowensis]HRJ94152.1 aminoacyl-tRNA hydrolase [Candidatus Thiothrix moscowensis]